MAFLLTLKKEDTICISPYLGSQSQIIEVSIF